MHDCRFNWASASARGRNIRIFLENWLIENRKIKLDDYATCASPKKIPRKILTVSRESASANGPVKSPNPEKTRNGRLILRSTKRTCG
jgi:hypothetical protein